jgi:hypothetical protein
VSGIRRRHRESALWLDTIPTSRYVVKKFFYSLWKSQKCTRDPTLGRLAGFKSVTGAFMK